MISFKLHFCVLVLRFGWLKFVFSKGAVTFIYLYTVKAASIILSACIMHVCYVYIVPWSLRCASLTIVHWTETRSRFWAEWLQSTFSGEGQISVTPLIYAVPVRISAWCFHWLLLEAFLLTDKKYKPAGQFLSKM